MSVVEVRDWLSALKYPDDKPLEAGILRGYDGSQLVAATEATLIDANVIEAACKVIMTAVMKQLPGIFLSRLLLALADLPSISA